MAALTLGYRQSAADSLDENRSRYIPSSVYSGPGPDVDVVPVAQPVQPVNSMHAPHGVRNGAQNGYERSNGFSIPFTPRPRTSEALNINDPVAMHLLTETALGDSKSFEVLSYEELEQLKAEKTRLRNKIQGTKRKIALETKLRDAAQSLNRLYAKAGRDGPDTRGHRRNATGSSKGSVDVSSRAEDEFTASQQKILELTESLEMLQDRLDNTQRRILEHTAGVLQMTHRGLKKNLRRNEMPRSPESMASPGQRSVSGGPLLDTFDERSLYPVPDYVNEFIGTTPMTPMLMTHSKSPPDTQAMNKVARTLHSLSDRLHTMAAQMQVIGPEDEPPKPFNSNGAESVSSYVGANLDFLTRGLDSLATAQQRTLQESQNVTGRINDMLEKTKSIGQSPALVRDTSEGNDLASQLAFSTRVLEQLHSRIGSLVEQKDILTRQIQQQRELNSKSDAERDMQLHDLTAELAETQRKHARGEEESQRAQHEISQLMDELDRARDNNQLLEKQRGMSDETALSAEREARKRTEKDLTDQVEAKHQINEQLQASLLKVQNDFDSHTQQHLQKTNDLSRARDLAETNAKGHQAEAEKLLEKMASVQTELVMAKAELDAAYGSRAQRAADVSSNPAIQKQIDDMRSMNSQLQRELKETIEDYEQMTKASIEFEKERDTFEASIDKLRDKCETLETQLNEEKLKSLGSKSVTTHDTTSTTVLKNEFKKMMRDSKTESMKAIRHEQEERRKLEALIRQMRKDAGLGTPSKSAPSATHLLAPAATPT